MPKVISFNASKAHEVQMQQLSPFIEGELKLRQGKGRLLSKWIAELVVQSGLLTHTDSQDK
jgi:hypothetical protein